MKQNLRIAVVAVMLTICTAGAFAAGGSEGSAEGIMTQSGYPITKETVTYEVMASVREEASKPYNEMEFFKEYEEITNVHIEWLTYLQPTYGENAATGRGYSMMAYVASSVAHFIRDLGYKAIPCGNDTALSIPMAVDAGLGELGRNGLLMTPMFGPRVRISKVFTNLPLVPDEPVEIGARKMCEVCGKCAEKCPGQAISFDEPTTEGPTISNNHGIYKWYINPERCFQFWVRNGGDCANCIRVCVFNKHDNWFHNFIRWQVKNLSFLDKFYLRMDDLFGYGKMIKMEEIWK
jgi:reductive dehalogenase